jgi:hypothetical protein
MPSPQVKRRSSDEPSSAGRAQSRWSRRALGPWRYRQITARTTTTRLVDRARPTRKRWAMVRCAMHRSTLRLVSLRLVDAVSLAGLVGLVLVSLGCSSELRGQRCPPGSLLTACQQRCISDGDCLAPARCDRLTGTCQQLAILCDPLALSSSTSPDGGSDRSGSCPQGQECDLITRTCVPLSGAACGQDLDCRVGELCAGGVCSQALDARGCQRDADCAAPWVCRLTVASGQLRSVCAAALGPSEGGSRCRSNTECQSGLCLRSGVCFAGCTKATSKLDCHGRDGVICGQVPLSLPGTSPDAPITTVQSCTLASSGCQADRDCESSGGTCQPIVDVEPMAQLRTVCMLARGPARPGAPCTQDTDCATGLCHGSFCFAACRSTADCRTGFACRSASYRVDTLRGSLQGCVPARACTSQASCPASDETCAPQPTASEQTLELVCTPGRGLRAGQACRADAECASGLCSEQGLCIGGCGTDSDCPAGPRGQIELCRPQTARVRGVSGVIKACQIPPTPCRRDADCTMPDTSCNPYPSLDDATRIAPGCGPTPQPGKRGAGTACILNSECKSGICLMNTQPPVCYGPCGQDADCVASRRCYADSTWFLTSGTAGQPSATYDATWSCWPDVGSRKACAGDGSAADCPAGEICVLLPDARQTVFVKRCQRPLGTNLPGAICVEDKDCQSGRCAQAIGGTGRRCVAPCSIGGPSVCSPGTGCKAGTLEIRPGKTASLAFCQP